MQRRRLRIRNVERSGVPSPLRDGTHRVFLRTLYRGDELLEARFTRRRLSPRLGVRGLTPRSRTPPALLGPALGRSAISAGASCPCQRRLSQLTEMLDRDRPRRHHAPEGIPRWIRGTQRHTLSVVNPQTSRFISPLQGDGRALESLPQCPPRASCFRRSRRRTTSWSCISPVRSKP